jgi:16S rRNA (guanine(966)-N(2))-methyltransferase RsmD
MRIIAGTFRSRQLKSLKGLALRPTSDRLRESLFNVLADRIPGCHFLDVFAGTGAVGIEALSRGAAGVVFIENHSPAATLIQQNLDSLGVSGCARILKLDALRALQRLAEEHNLASTPFDIVFLDPPYAAAEEYGRVLAFLGSAAFLAPGGLVIAEHRRTFDLPEALGQLERVRVLRQGDASLSFFWARPSANPNPPPVHLST